MNSIYFLNNYWSQENTNKIMTLSQKKITVRKWINIKKPKWIL